MIKAKTIDGLEFLISDISNIYGADSEVKQIFTKAKKEGVMPQDGPVAGALFEKMEKIKPDFFVLIERKDPPLEDGVTY